MEDNNQPNDKQPDVKDAKPDTEHVNIKVIGPDNSEVMFKIKTSTKLSKLMTAYCSRTGQTMGSVRFLVDGQRISPDDTPQGLGLEEGDAIDAMTEQVGGCRC
ncbi:SUMO protein smt3 [Coemansia sp. RSA 2681]|nr:SUMO protein smt3 [Coemansia sp. RSA 25]KAJ2326451.1 SUMO protein smt3 [Coemansia sp. RSA 2681]KAJ2441724.1 SUMO protein smt3 [Coemansia sp. RSA 2424]KAJ2442380.1 SUMO protein smt3 [Coemansia sp. RSA 2424]